MNGLETVWFKLCLVRMERIAWTAIFVKGIPFSFPFVGPLLIVDEGSVGPFLEGFGSNPDSITCIFSSLQI